MKIIKIAKETQPYQIYKMCWGIRDDTGIEIEAVSPEQARLLALSKHQKLREYRELGCEIEAKLNVEKHRQRERAKGIENRLKEETIRDAWWNK
jgi:hypothetical protein